MKEIGLQPTDTGEEGGKETGDKVAHLIVPDGKFDKAVTRLLARDFAITWREKSEAPQGGVSGDGEAEEKKSGKRVKYVCAHPECKLKAWAKHDIKLICGEHMAAMEPD